ncbi:diaminopimelate epimerase [Nigerium sp.]|uniref:diaminopimelate epimerase n=1 Tax=Nigerium sp. TaxID=2042655 RepID=UPI0032214F00
MLSFAKGHGTLNDFVLLVDRDNERGLTDDEVRFLCDRRAGIGGDGLLRVVRAHHVPEWRGDPDLWFMDYRNADGSIAEMCGNGVRVFCTYLKQQGLVRASATSVDVATRAGLRRGEYLPDGQIRVWMGRPSVADADVPVGVGAREYAARPVDVGNPHAVALVEAGVLDDLDLEHEPSFPHDVFPRGVNREFVEHVASDVLRMRVFERGVGETLSCGTGTVAVAAAAARASGATEASYEVRVRGGVVRVDLAHGEAWLTGPAVIVAHGEVSLPTTRRKDEA